MVIKSLIRTIQDSLDRGAYSTLPGHDGLVTCVHWLSDQLFVSGDDKGVLRFWKFDGSQACSSGVSSMDTHNNASSLQWKSFAAHRAHRSGISSLAAFGQIVVTGASDSMVKVWKTHEDKLGMLL